MKRILFFLFFAVLICQTYSQTSCYNENRSRGISLFNSGKYNEAIKVFTVAKSCPDKPKSNDLDSWIQKCKSKSTPPPVKTDTYIRVDSKSSVSSTHPASGGTEYFNITTDAKSWSTWGVPSWCSIEEKSFRSFRLRVIENTSSSERSDYMEVRTPNGHSARINIKQSGKSGSNKANVENVTFSHNKLVGGEPGMEIHFKLTISTLKDKKCSVVAYFYDESGNNLKDTNGKYSTSSNTVCAFHDITPIYESSVWSDLNITIPYSELHLSSYGTQNIKVHIAVWDESTSPSKTIYSSRMYNTSFYYSTSSTSAFDIDGTTRSYTDNATALTYLTDAIKEKQSCQHGAITETKGVIIMQDYGYNHTAGINSYLANKIKELNQSRTKITSIAMTNSGYYCVTYEKNGYYGYMPGDMSTKMKEFNNNGETIYCVSISENGAYVIVTDKHFVASNSTDNTNMKKASDKYGTIKDVCITNLGICIICSQGVYYRNIPTNVEEKIKSCKVKPDHIRFTDSGTFLITYENGNNYKYYM